MKHNKILFYLFTISTICIAQTSSKINLHKGWNLAGTPKNDILQSLLSNATIETIWKYNNGWEATSNNATIQTTFTLLNIPQITTINAGEGFWIYTNNQSQIEINGSTALNTDFNITKGWQLLALKEDNASITPNQLNHIEKIQSIWKYKDSAWSLFYTNDTNNSQLTQLNFPPIDSLNSYEGFWIYSNNSEDTTNSYEDLTSKTIVNNAGAYITSQCYTKTIDQEGKTHNPCYSCHINSQEPNYLTDDHELQSSYDFSEYTKINRWTNLFKDRTDDVNAISDETILNYVRESNYFTSDNKIALKETLSKNLPPEWDFPYDGTKDGIWSGYIPDCYFNFDQEGFDRDYDGNYTGWRAFSYYPFLGTFWPTNGSTDDVLIRLPQKFQQNKNGEFDLKVYKINLAIVESLIKQKNIPIETTDENTYGVDLNQNGILDTAQQIVFNWEVPSYEYSTKKYSNYSMHYVGAAYQAQIDNNNVNMAPGLYPQETEFLHSVRYLDLNNDNSIKMAKRMKELRYGKKTKWNTYPQLSNAAMSEIKEKETFPDRLRTITGNIENGLNTGLGWVYQGFIEDKSGELRPQTYEETMFCIGCHSGIGAIVDSTFVFPRKTEDPNKNFGWYHWSQSGLKDMIEPTMPNGDYEYTKYLVENSAGDEFRDNKEVMEKFFNGDGTINQAEVTKIHNDISYLLLPSKQRALELNKAYKVIVNEQSYIYGRDAHIKPITNVHKELQIGESTGIKTPIKK